MYELELEALLLVSGGKGDDLEESDTGGSGGREPDDYT